MTILRSLSDYSALDWPVTLKEMNDKTAQCAQQDHHVCVGLSCSILSKKKKNNNNNKNKNKINK